MENKTIKLELTINDVNLILKGLGELKFNESSELIGKIQNEGIKQLNENEKEKEK